MTRALQLSSYVTLMACLQFSISPTYASQQGPISGIMKAGVTEIDLAVTWRG